MLLGLLLPWLVLAAPLPDCGSTHDATERLICADPALGAQQSKEQELYAVALEELPAAERSVQQDREAAWRHERANCASAQEPHRCLSDQLGRRLVELQITLKQVPVFAAVTYRCEGPKVTRLFASYYRTEPAAVRLRYQDQEVFAFVAAAASGARYLGENVEIWEHQGVARFSWHGRQMSCPKQ
jgi:uncharacterized protein